MHTCPHFLFNFRAQPMKIVILTPFSGPKKGHLVQGSSRGWSICLIFMPFHIRYPYHTVNTYLSHFLVTFSTQTMKIVILTPFLGPKKGNLGLGLSWWWSICLIFMPIHIQYAYHPINAYLSPLFSHFYCSTHENCYFEPLFGPKKGDLGPGCLWKSQ